MYQDILFFELRCDLREHNRSLHFACQNLKTTNLWNIEFMLVYDKFKTSRPSGEGLWILILIAILLSWLECSACAKTRRVGITFAKKVHSKSKQRLTTQFNDVTQLFHRYRIVFNTQTKGKTIKFVNNWAGGFR